MHNFITLSSTKALFAVHKYFKETFSITCSYLQTIYLSRFTRFLKKKVKQKQFPQHAMHSFFYYLHFHVKRKKCSTDKSGMWSALQHWQSSAHNPENVQPTRSALRLAGDCEDDRWGSTSQNRKTAILLLGQNNLERRHLSGTLLGSLRDEWEARHSLKDCNSTNMTVEIHRYISKIK